MILLGIGLWAAFSGYWWVVAFCALGILLEAASDE